MIRKPFSQQLHDDNDPVARLKVQDYFMAQQGIELVENPDKYDIDLLHKSNGDILAGYEVERRHNWATRDFPFSTLHIPERKAKYADMPFPTFYIATNKLINCALMMPFTELTKAYCNEQKNRFVGQGEFFYNVPVTATEIIYLDEKRYGSD